MVTRFYLPSSGTPPLTNVTPDAGWDQQGNLVRLPCYTTKTNTALTTRTLLWPTTSIAKWLWWQFISPPLATAATFTITTDTFSLIIGKCAETTLSGNTTMAGCFRIVSNDGLTNRGTFKSLSNSATEYPLVASAATRTFGTTAYSATVNALASDRIVFEVGVNGATPAAENIQMRTGDPTAGIDFTPFTNGQTTDNRPWLELTTTCTFAAEGAFEPGPAGLLVPKRKLHQVFSFHQPDAHVVSGAPPITDNNVGTLAPPPPILDRPRPKIKAFPQPYLTGPAVTPQARHYFNAESLSRTTTTTNDFSYQKATLTFQPVASKTYAIFWNVLVDGNVAGALESMEASFFNDTGAAEVENNGFTCANTTHSNIPLGGMYVWTAGASPPSQTFSIYCRRGPSATLTLGMSEAVICAVELLTGYDGVTGNATETIYTNTSFTQHLALDWRQENATDLFALLYAETQSTTGEIAVQVKDIDNNTYNVHDLAGYNQQPDWCPYTAAIRLPNSTKKQKFSIEVKSAAGTNVKIRNAYICVFDLDGFLNSYTAEDRTVHTDVTGTYQNSASVTATPQAADHLVLAVGQTTTNAATANTATGQKINAGGTDVGSLFTENRGFLGYQFNWFSVRKRTETNVSTTWKTQYARTVGADNATSDEHVLAVLQLSAPSAEIVGYALKRHPQPHKRYQFRVPLISQPALGNQEQIGVDTRNDICAPLPPAHRWKDRTPAISQPVPIDTDQVGVDTDDDVAGSSAHNPPRRWKSRTPAISQPVLTNTDQTGVDTKNDIAGAQPPVHRKSRHVPLIDSGDLHIAAVVTVTDDYDPGSATAPSRRFKHTIPVLSQPTPTDTDQVGSDTQDALTGARPPVHRYKNRTPAVTQPVPTDTDQVGPDTRDSLNGPPPPVRRLRFKPPSLALGDNHIAVSVVVTDDYDSGAPRPPVHRLKHNVPALAQPILGDTDQVGGDTQDALAGARPPVRRWKSTVSLYSQPIPTDKEQVGGVNLYSLAHPLPPSRRFKACVPIIPMTGEVDDIIVSTDVKDALTGPRPPVHRWEHNVPGLPQPILGDRDQVGVDAQESLLGPLPPRRRWQSRVPALGHLSGDAHSAPITAPVGEDSLTGPLPPRRRWQARVCPIVQPILSDNDQVGPDTRDSLTGPLPPVHRWKHGVPIIAQPAIPDDAVVVTDVGDSLFGASPPRTRQVRIVRSIPQLYQHPEAVVVATDDNSTSPIKPRFAGRHGVPWLPQGDPNRDYSLDRDHAPYTGPRHRERRPVRFLPWSADGFAPGVRGEDLSFYSHRRPWRDVCRVVRALPLPIEAEPGSFGPGSIATVVIPAGSTYVAAADAQDVAIPQNSPFNIAEDSATLVVGGDDTLIIGEAP